mgnify:FL=1
MINEISDQWMLIAAVSVVGFVAGWFARHSLLSFRKKTIDSTLYEVQGKFADDEREVFSKMRFITGQIVQMRAAAEAQQLAAGLTEEKMSELYNYVEYNFFSNEIPNNLDRAKKLVRSLETIDEGGQRIVKAVDPAQ